MPKRMLLLVVQLVSYAVLSRNLEESWSYTGVGFQVPGPWSVVLALLSCALVAAALPSAVQRPSDSALWLLASFVVTPTLAVSAVNPLFTWSTRATASASVVVGFLVVAWLCRPNGRAFEVKGPGYLSRTLFAALVVAMAVAAIATIALGYGLSAWDLSLGDEYVRRLAAQQTVSPFPGANYLQGWLLSPLIPFLTVMGLQWKMKPLLFVVLTSVILIWGFDGQKVAFVYPAIAVMIWMSMRRSQSGIPWLGALLTFGLIVLPTTIGWVLPTSQIDYLITRRFGLTPGILTHYYVQYVEGSGFTLFSQSWARIIGPGEDSTSMGIRVGEWLEPGSGLNANAHLWADGYASAGVLGVVVTGLLLVVVLRLFDRVAVSRDALVAGATLGTVALVYVNGYFHTSLLTGGVIVALALVWAMPDPRYSAAREGSESHDDELLTQTRAHEDTAGGGLAGLASLRDSASVRGGE